MKTQIVCQQDYSFCPKELRLWHFSREGRENLHIRVLRTKFWVKSACEDAPQVVPACVQLLNWYIASLNSSGTWFSMADASMSNFCVWTHPITMSQKTRPVKKEIESKNISVQWPWHPIIAQSSLRWNIPSSDQTLNIKTRPD